MGREALIEKLDRELQQDIDSEMQVVYVLVEVRKYLEREKLQGEFKVLTFFCNWAVHSKGMGYGAERILRRFDNAHGLLGTEADVGKLSPDLQTEIGETVSLARFKAEFAAFLRSIQLPTSIADDRARWLKFLKRYSGVIEDCPLVLTNKRDIKQEDAPAVELKHLKQIIVKREEMIPEVEVPATHEVVFATRWQLLDKAEHIAGEFSMQFMLPKDDGDSRGDGLFTRT